MWVDVIDLQLRLFFENSNKWQLHCHRSFVHSNLHHDLSCLAVDKYLLIERESRFDLIRSDPKQQSMFMWASIKYLSISSKQAKWEMSQCHLNLFLLLNSSGLNFRMLSACFHISNRKAHLLYWIVDRDLQCRIRIRIQHPVSLEVLVFFSSCVCYFSTYLVGLLNSVHLIQLILQFVTMTRQVISWVIEWLIKR